MNVVDFVTLKIGPEEREARGRMRVLEEALERLRRAYWHALERGGREVVITLSLRAHDLEDQWRY